MDSLISPSPVPGSDVARAKAAHWTLDQRERIQQPWIQRKRTDKAACRQPPSQSQSSEFIRAYNSKPSQSQSRLSMVLPGLWYQPWNNPVLIPVSDFKGLPYLLRQGELLRLREPQKWILRPIWGLVGSTQGSAVYHPVSICIYI